MSACASKVKILKIVGEHLSNGRHKNRKAKKKKPSNEEDQQAEKEEELGHVMISYQWGNQKVLTEIRDKLIDNGLKVMYDQLSVGQPESSDGDTRQTH